jgi:hypothetical protein
MHAHIPIAHDSGGLAHGVDLEDAADITSYRRGRTCTEAVHGLPREVLMA